jgi:hypothetical protein
MARFADPRKRSRIGFAALRDETVKIPFEAS